MKLGHHKMYITQKSINASLQKFPNQECQTLDTQHKANQEHQLIQVKLPILESQLDRQ